jgi:Flp pilus assembly protein TadG
MAETTDFIRHLKRLRTDRSGGVMTTFAVISVVLVTASGAALDYINLSNKRAELQRIADTSALAAVREFRLGNAAVATVSQAAINFAGASLSSSNTKATVTPTVDLPGRAVTVRLDADVPTYVMSVLGSKLAHVMVQGTARVVGGAPICVIGLNASAANTIQLAETSKLVAPGCAVYSGSSNKNSLVVQDLAAANAAFFCSTGGAKKSGLGTFTPTPQQDCPALPDPLASRPPPPVGSCTEPKTVKIDTGAAILNPGVYCGGIQISGIAKVTFQPGIYVIKGGPLKIQDAATVNGTNVGFYLTGSDAKLGFEGVASISLTAPKVGAMAGILFFEDRTNTANQKHLISSSFTRVLLGTIYLSRGQLSIESQNMVADKSAYTIIVANRFTLAGSPTIVLNTDYYNTDVPVPDGVGPNASKTVLSN